MKEPRRIGKYEIRAEIGRGGFAVVYKARDTELERIVALKVLAPHLLWDDTFTRRFRAEFETVAELRHPNIVSVYEYGEAEGQPYIAMEYLSGVTLGQLLKEAGRPLPLDRVLHFIQQLAAALTYALRRGIVHRDIKPNNVIVDAEDGVKLADFGISKVAARTFQTTTGRIFGSPEYMSPEQARGEDLDHRSDVYSLGVILYEMLTGRAPFTGDTPLSVMLSHCEREPVRPSELNPNLPAPVEAAVLKALAKSREDRFHSAGELAHDLRRAVEGKAQVMEKALPTDHGAPLLPSRSVSIAQKPGTGSGWNHLKAALVVLTGLVGIVALTWALTGPWSHPVDAPASLPPAATNTTTPLPTWTLPPSRTPEATETPFSPTPTPTTPATPDLTPVLLWSNDFSQPSPGHTDERFEGYDIEGERYLWIKTAHWYGTSWLGETSDKFDDFAVEVEAHKVAGTDFYGYGLLFRAQNSKNFYSFAVNSDQKYAFRKMVEGEWQNLTGWVESSLINPSMAVNHLRVECRGTELKAYVNGQPVGSPLYDVDFATGRVGIIAGTENVPDVRIAFDNFQVWSLP